MGGGSGPLSSIRQNYRLFNGTSSTIAKQNPWGLTVVAFFTIWIFIVTPKQVSWTRYEPAR
jgi:hypothetical protein